MSTQNIQPEVQPVPPFDPEQVWQAERKKGIGGSEVHHLFPCLNLEDKDDVGSRYGCPRRLSYEKLDVRPDYEYTPETLRLFERGHILEEYAADKFVEKTGKRVFRSNFPWVSKQFPWMRCNIDRRIKADDRGVGVLECKSASEHVFGRMEQEGLPTAYALQLQHSIMAMDIQWGAFSVIESPDYLDAVIEQMEDGRLRRRVIETIAKNFECFSFEVQRDDSLIGVIVEKERDFWSLIEDKKLANPLPEMNDERCRACPFRRSCRGAAYAEANARIPVRDKKTGLQYTQIEAEPFVRAAADRLVIMREINEKSELLKAIDNELKQNFPPEVGAVQIPGVGIKVRWNWQKGASRWDSDALKAASKTIGRKIAFADWVEDSEPSLVAEFSNEHKSVPSLEDLYKVQSAPSRPFVFSVKGEE